MRLALLLLALAPATAAQSSAPPAPARALADDLAACCADFLTESLVVGLSVAILDDGEVVYEGAAGARDREAGLPAETSTLFRLASVSKPVTATLAMLLVEEEKLDLDTAVSRWVEDLEPALGSVTLRQILSHTSGIRHYRPDRRDDGTRSRTTSEALALFRGDPLRFPPGEKYAYSTHAYTLAVAVLEQASGQDFVTLLRQRVARGHAPALDAEVAADEKPQRSALYEKRGKDVLRCTPRQDLSWKYGGGGLESTAGDLARFAEAVRTAKLVGEAARDAMWTRQRTKDGQAIDYGLGWGVGDGVVQHSGAQQGASSWLVVLPEEGTVLAVLTNTSDGNARALGRRLRELLAAR